jgi:CBS domain-containing protein
MILTTSVMDVMTKELVTIKTTDKAIVAIDVMTKNDVGSVVVTKDKKPVGILTERDIIKKVCPRRRCREVTAEELMSTPLITIQADAKLGEAAFLMTNKNIRRLLVVNQEGIVGIVTQKDIMKGTLTFLALAST